MASQTTTNLAQCQEILQQRESTLQERMDRMLNQWRVNLEQEFKRRHTESLEACCADFHAKTNAALE
jgi:hypothetical protein